MASNEEIAADAAQAQAEGKAVDLPPIKVAFIIDGLLVDILHTDDRLAAIFLSEPKVVDVSDIYQTLVRDSRYNEQTGQFTAPE
jgi:hypothetical protein